MKVLLLNGSPHKDGCTATALHEVENQLNELGIETKWYHIGNQAIRGCVACGYCRKNNQCVFDDLVNEVSKEFEKADGIVVGSPVYYSSPNGSVLSFLDRLFYSSNFDKTMKVGASVVSARRGGNSSTFDVLNKYFTISSMPIVSSTYWNQVHGFTKEDAQNDLEGLQTMRNLARNMAFLLKGIQLAKEQEGIPKQERQFQTNFMDHKS